MPNRTKSLLPAFAVVILIIAAARKCPAEDKPTPPAPAVYASPQEVFDAFRAATDKQDWRTLYYCWTPEARESQVYYEAYVACQALCPKATSDAVLKKYRVDDASVIPEYCKRYQEKHGIDPAKLEAENDRRLREQFEKHLESLRKEGKPLPPPGIAVPIPAAAPPGPPPPPNDEPLFREIVMARITYKAAFFEEAKNAFEKTHPKDPWGDPLGNLEQVRIKGNEAAGCASQPMYHLYSAPGVPTTKVIDAPATRTFYFRLSQDGWRISAKR